MKYKELQMVTKNEHDPEKVAGYLIMPHLPALSIFVKGGNESEKGYNIDFLSPACFLIIILHAYTC